MRVGVGGRTRFCSFASSSEISGGTRSTRVGGDLTELHVDAARFFEHEPEPHTRVGDGAFLAAGGGDERAEALAPDEPHELAVPAKHREPHPDRAHRARRGDEPGPLPHRQRAWSSEEVERHRGGHRGRDRDRERVEDHAVGAPVPVGDAERDERAETQPITPETSAVIQPRRIPSRRKATTVVERPRPRCATSTPRTISNTEAAITTSHDPIRRRTAARRRRRA